MGQRLRLLVFVVILAMTAAACGGGSDSNAAGGDGGDTTVTAPNTGDDSETATATPEPVETPTEAPEPTATPEPTAEPEPTVDPFSVVTPAFCQSSADVWVASEAFNIVDPDNFGAVEAAMNEIVTQLEAATADAPNAEQGEPANQMLDAALIMQDELAGFDFDWIAYFDSDVFNASGAALEFVTVLEELEDFLENGPCDGPSLGILNVAAAGLAADLEAENPVTTPADPGSTDDYVTVDHSEGRIRISIPASWKFEETAEAGYADLVAAPDLAAFYDTWSSDGFIMQVVDEPDPANWDTVIANNPPAVECDETDRSTDATGPRLSTVIGYDCADNFVLVQSVWNSDTEVGMLFTIQFEGTPDDADEALLAALVDALMWQ